MKKLLLLAAMSMLTFASASTAFAAQAKRAIMVVSFGTSYNDTRAVTIDAIERDVAAAFPGWKMQRAFTAQTIIDRVAARDGVHFPNTDQALSLLWSEGIREVVVQPTHVMNGFEYDDLIADLMKNVKSFDSIRVGTPLLTSVEDYEAVIEAIFSQIKDANDPDTAFVFMGHGTEHSANSAYSELELLMHRAGHANAFVGTVEGYPELDDVIKKVKASGAKKAVLYPLMIVAGDHANNDMAGDEDDSWKTAFKAAGLEVETRLVGLGELPGIRELFIEHARDAVNGAPLQSVKDAVVLPGKKDPSKRAILVASFGTSFNDTRAKTIDVIEREVAAARPGWEVRRAFTAQTIIDRVYARDGVKYDNVGEAMARLIKDGYGTVVVMPTHVMPGFEYDDVVSEVETYKKYFSRLEISTPLLSETKDHESVVAALARAIPELGSRSTAVVLMGHGTEHWANSSYSQFQLMLRGAGYSNAFVGTVENYPLIDDVIDGLKAFGAKHVILVPFMIVAGDHANNDMAGDEDDSWKTMIEAAGFTTESRIMGLGENAAIREIFVEHLSEAISR